MVDYDPKDKGMNSPAEQEEILNKEVRLDGAGEAPVIKALLSDDFAKVDDQEALSIGAALRDLIRGQAALLQNQKAQDEEVRKMRVRFELMEEDAKRWRDDPTKFADEARTKADKVRLTGADKERTIAEGARIQREAAEEANAEAVAEELEFRQKCANAPRVTISAFGKHWRTKVGDGFVDKVESDVIRVSVGKRIFQWILPPDEPVDVPDFIAKEYWENKRRAKEQDKIRDILLPDDKGQFRNYDDIKAKFPELDPNKQMIGTVVNMNG